MREKGEGSKEGKTIVLGCFLEDSSGGTVSSIQQDILRSTGMPPGILPGG